MRKEHPRLGCHRGAQRHVELRKRSDIGPLLVEVAQVEPLPGKVLGQRLGVLVRQHPRDLGGENQRLVQLALSRQREQPLVRDRAPQEQRQPRGEIVV